MNADQTYMQGADFGDVLRALKAGRKARREAWQDGPFVVSAADDHVDVRIWLAGKALSVAYTPGWPDIFANDWIIFSDPSALP